MLARNFSKTTFRKLLKFNQGKFLTMIFVKKTDREGWKTEPHFQKRMSRLYFILRSISNVKKCNIAAILIFFWVHTKLYAQKSWKRTCPCFNPVTPLLTVIATVATDQIFNVYQPIWVKVNYSKNNYEINFVNFFWSYPWQNYFKPFK